jgi:hypothetical protein
MLARIWLSIRNGLLKPQKVHDLLSRLQPKEAVTCQGDNHENREQPRERRGLMLGSLGICNVVW